MNADRLYRLIFRVSGTILSPNNRSCSQHAKVKSNHHSVATTNRTGDWKKRVSRSTYPERQFWRRFQRTRPFGNHGHGFGLENSAASCNNDEVWNSRTLFSWIHFISAIAKRENKKFESHHLHKIQRLKISLTIFQNYVTLFLKGSSCGQGLRPRTVFSIFSKLSSRQFRWYH